MDVYNTNLAKEHCFQNCVKDYIFFGITCFSKPNLFLNEEIVSCTVRCRFVTSTFWMFISLKNNYFCSKLITKITSNIPYTFQKGIYYFLVFGLVFMPNVL